MIHYYVNWMGPIGMYWYRARGLTTTKHMTLKHGYKGYAPGAVIEYEDITQYYAGGRIDVSTGEELGLPFMLLEDYRSFASWLESFTSESTWTLAQLVQQYEKHHAKLRWASELKVIQNEPKTS